jgi:hypothetical protein
MSRIIVDLRLPSEMVEAQASEATTADLAVIQKAGEGFLRPIDPLAMVPDLPADRITSGSFDAARIPSLDAAKIATGTFEIPRIPSLPASIIGSGAFDAARIPSLPASIINAGTFPTERLAAGAISETAEVRTAQLVNGSTSWVTIQTVSLTPAHAGQLVIFSNCLARLVWSGSVNSTLRFDWCLRNWATQLWWRTAITFPVHSAHGSATYETLLTQAYLLPVSANVQVSLTLEIMHTIGSGGGTLASAASNRTIAYLLLKR